MDLTDEQWRHVEKCLPPEELRPPGKKGGRPWRPAREVMNGVLKEMLCRLADHLRDIGKIDLSEGFIDGTHAGAKKGAARSGWRHSTWQGDQGHGSGRPQRPSYRRWDCRR